MSDEITPSPEIRQLTTQDLIGKYRQDLEEVRQDARELQARIGDDECDLEYDDLNNGGNNIIDLMERF